MKRFLVSSCLLVFSSILVTPAKAINWVYIGNRSGFNYFVDIDSDTVSGMYWSSPIKATRLSDRRDFFGKLHINCRDFTYSAEVEEQYYSNWTRILSGTPADYVADRVCKKK